MRGLAGHAREETHRIMSTSMVSQTTVPKTRDMVVQSNSSPLMTQPSENWTGRGGARRGQRWV